MLSFSKHDKRKINQTHLLRVNRVNVLSTPGTEGYNKNDLTQEQATKIAQDYIHNQYDPAVNLDDPALYKMLLKLYAA